MDRGRLQQQIGFLVEIDKLKQVFRQTVLMDASRNENDAEHSWHLGMLAILLKEYAAAPVELEKVLKMVLIHDLVEIDAGDTFCYDVHANWDKAAREQKAADRIFGLLPIDQERELRALWEEFEGRESVEARFAAALDRLQPLIHNYHTQGHTWKKGNVTSGQVIARNEKIQEGAPTLWDYAREIIEDAIGQGILKR